RPRSDGERSQPAGCEMRSHQIERQRSVLRVAGDHRLDRRSAALEGEVHGVQPRAPVDLLADEEAQRADAGRREVDAAGLRPGRAYEFAQVLSPGGRLRAYDQSEAREQGDRVEIAKGGVGQLFER